MKRTCSANFQFDVPEDWEEFGEGGRHVWQGRGPALQELIVQGMLQGEGSALQDEALVIERPLAPDASLALEPAWTAKARAPADQTLFCGAVFRAGDGVILVTFETSPKRREMSRCLKPLSVRCEVRRISVARRLDE